MPSLAAHMGSGDTGSDSANEQKKFTVPLASVAKSTQKLHVSNIPPNMEESGKFNEIIFRPISQLGILS